MEKTEVIIIGAGPIGLACGIACQKVGLDYLILDKGVLVNSIFHYPLNMTFFSTSDRLEMGDVPFISHTPKPTRTEALEYYRRVTLHWKLKVRLFEAVLNVAKTENGYLVTSAKASILCQHIIIATGFYDIPNLLNIPGESLPNVHHYYKEPHLYFKQKIVVVGAANSAVDVALETFRKGAEVTMVVREPHIRETVKYWVKPDIENRIREGEIKAFFNASLTAIREREVDITTENGSQLTIENDFVLAMTGYRPDFNLLENMGVKLNALNGEIIPEHNPSTLETNVPGIFLAGVICGGTVTNSWFIENSRIHADIAVREILSRKQRLH